MISYQKYTKLKNCFLNFHAMNDDFEGMLKLSYNSNTPILDKI